MKAGDLMKELQEAYPHIQTRLSKEGDPELSSVLISFLPKAIRSKTDTPTEKSGQDEPDEY